MIRVDYIRYGVPGFVEYSSEQEARDGIEEAVDNMAWSAQKVTLEDGTEIERPRLLDWVYHFEE